MNAAVTPLLRFWQPRYWPIWPGIAMLRLVVMLPRRAQLWVARRIGGILRMVLPERRHIARANLALCFPELDPTEQRNLLRRHFDALGMTVLELALSWWATDSELDGLIQINGIEHVHAALEQGRGVLLLSGHFTSAEFTGRQLRLMVPPFAGMYRPNRNPLVDQLMRRCCSRSATYLIAKDSIRELVRALRNNTIVWYSPDQAYSGKNSVIAPFFGEAAMTSPATSQIARISGAAVVPYLPRRLEDGSGYIVDLLPALENFPGDDLAADAARINRLLEDQIRKAPDQYYWIHRRFKRRPAEYGDPYSR
jgi:KDO2-lipid IV(A) lauroyltransferase